jgi:hypothetical protein
MSNLAFPLLTCCVGLHPDEVKGCQGVHRALLNLTNHVSEAAAFRQQGRSVALNLFNVVSDPFALGTKANVTRYKYWWRMFVSLMVCVGVHKTGDGTGRHNCNIGGEQIGSMV